MSTIALKGTIVLFEEFQDPCETKTSEFLCDKVRRDIRKEFIHNRFWVMESW